MTLASLLNVLREVSPRTLAYVYEASREGLDCIDAGELDELKLQAHQCRTVLSAKPAYFLDQERRGIEIIIGEA